MTPNEKRPRAAIACAVAACLLIALASAAGGLTIAASDGNTAAANSGWTIGADKDWAQPAGGNYPLRFFRAQILRNYPQF
jgi:hypothetical protein